ncbi:MAG: D-alanyl-D-alanine carboxypeptidase family protein [Treponema sp.]
MKKKSYLKTKITVFAVLLVSLFAACFFARRNSVLKSGYDDIPELSFTEKLIFESKIKEAGYERNDIIHPLPYKTISAELDIKAESAILINSDTGDILYEKNADELIPPASMTKIFLMYTVFQKISEGKVSLDDFVPLTEECWASRMPARSSLMFLGKGQTVTLRELLTGIAVCSGNDASHAVAYYLFGDTEKFISEVNRQIQLLGLTKTRIAEPSGYSEKNVTTAREMAAFARVYVSKFPESLELFHSVKKFTYPAQKNLPPEQRKRPPQDFSSGIPDEIWTPVMQENTNKLLKSLEGCDGLKTGYIDESGYNLSLTCLRNGVRCISVTMKGPGKNLLEGNEYRIADGTLLQEFGFNGFCEIPELNEIKDLYYVSVLGCKEDCAGLVPAFPVKTVVPKIYDENGNNLFGKIEVEYEIPKALYGKISCGNVYGKITVKSGNFVIEEIPLAAQKDIEESSGLKKMFDRLVYHSVKK